MQQLHNFNRNEDTAKASALAVLITTVLCELIITITPSPIAANRTFEIVQRTILLFVAIMTTVSSATAASTIVTAGTIADTVVAIQAEQKSSQQSW